MIIYDENGYRECLCGEKVHKNNNSHNKKCDSIQKVRSEFLLVEKQNVIETYLREYSIKQVMIQCVEKKEEYIKARIDTGFVYRILKEAGVYEGSSSNMLKARNKRLKETLFEKYGVENWGQTSTGGYKVMNQIPYEKIDVIYDGYKEYKEEVDRLTKNYVRTLKNNFPEYCYYTGIKFIDAIQEKVNPNDPRKRSVDHKIPKVICFLNGVSPEIAASKENIVFVLKYVNTLKGNTLHESFQTMSNKIRKVFTDAGFESN